MISNPEAFPRPASRGVNYITGEEDVVVDPQQGMTLLDWYAAHALSGILATSSFTNDPANVRLIAHMAYKQASVMLGVREQWLEATRQDPTMAHMKEVAQTTEDQ